MLRSIANGFVSTTSTREERLIGVASSPIACAMRTNWPPATDHAASIDRSRSRLASIFWRGITIVSLGCQTWTSGNSSGLVLVAVTRRERSVASADAFACHGATPTNTHAPSSDHCGVRNRTTRRSGGSAGVASSAGDRAGRDVGPHQQRVRRSFTSSAVGRAKRGQRGGFFPPRETRIGPRGRVERAQDAGSRVVNLQAVAHTAVDRHRKGERRALVLPRDLGDRSERGVLTSREAAQYQRCAGRDRLAGVALIAGAGRWRIGVAPHRHEGAGGTERERLDGLDRGRGARPQDSRLQAACGLASCPCAASPLHLRTIRPGTPPTSSRL